MIYESWPWRHDLLKDADLIERWLRKPIGERRSVLLEKKVFVAAYAVRKLLESDKLSSATDKREIPIDRFPSIKPISKQDRWDIHLHYNLEHGSPDTLPLYRLIDLIIHSFIFLEWQNEDSDTWYFALTSDRTRDKELYLIAFDEYLKLLRYVANDDPQVIIYRRDPETNQRTEWRGREDELPEGYFDS